MCCVVDNCLRANWSRANDTRTTNLARAHLTVKSRSSLFQTFFATSRANIVMILRSVILHFCATNFITALQIFVLTNKYVSYRTHKRMIYYFEDITTLRFNTKTKFILLNIIFYDRTHWTYSFSYSIIISFWLFSCFSVRLTFLLYLSRLFNNNCNAIQCLAWNFNRLLQRYLNFNSLFMNKKQPTKQLRSALFLIGIFPNPIYVWWHSDINCWVGWICTSYEQ